MDGGTFSGLDYFDVWIDKDAVIAPNGTVYFVDLEGLPKLAVPTFTGTLKRSESNSSSSSFTSGFTSEIGIIDDVLS